jgi:hypothetical protein
MLSAARRIRDRRESRFLARSALPSRRARNSKKYYHRVVRMPCRVIVQSFARRRASRAEEIGFARRRASRAEEIGFARGCSHVHFCTCFLSRVRF